MALPVAGAPACGCGAMIPSDPVDGGNARVDEWSIVHFDGSREDVAMRLESSAAFERAALILPVPSRARFSVGHDALFADIVERTKPRVEKKKRYVLFGSDEEEGDDETAAPAAGGGARGVEVVDAQDLGPLRVVTLRGDDAGVVGTWLSDHGFETPEGLETIAQEYLDRDWLLSAIRLRGEGGAEIRRLQPLIISFDSDEVVYPLRMSELANGPTEARVDVVAPEPLAVQGWPERDIAEPDDPGSGRLYAGPMPNDRYLTSYRFAIGDRGFEEPRFVRAARDDFRQTIEEVEEVDVTWVPFTALAVVAAGVLLVMRRRRLRSGA